jgi:putative multicomponent Na+:H+ antiporter subunit B
MIENDIYVLTALLPLAAFMVVSQVNPYHALVIRGILGGLAAMVYAILGAADVALTEALVGTMLAITLYAIAVRSSLVMRVGVLEKDGAAPVEDDLLAQLLEDLRAICRKHYLRLELVYYTNIQALQRGLIEKEIHVTCARSLLNTQDIPPGSSPYHTVTRIPRLYEILQAELTFPETDLSYLKAPELSHPDVGAAHP